jgi:RNA polymerase sigma-70 factor (ECF subfamily)
VSTHEFSDEELMTRYQHGDLPAFRGLFERYAGLLVRVLSRDIGDSALAEELVQQTFLHVHRARLDFDTSQRFKPWVFTIALNLKREAFRSRRRRPKLTPWEDREIGAPPVDHARLEARDSVAWALNRIPPDQREVIELHWFEGLSFQEVARCLGIGAVAAKVRAHRGYLQLRVLLTRNPWPERGI